MRIGLSIGKLDPHHGGAEAWTIALAGWLNGRGHEVHLFGFRAAPDLPISPEQVHLVAPTFNRIESASRIANRMESYGFDIIHDMGISLRSNVFHSHFGSFKAMELGKLASRSRMQSILRRFAPRSRRRLAVAELSSLQFAQRPCVFIAVSEMVARDLHRFESIPTDLIRVASNGVDLEKFNPLRAAALREEARRRFGIRPNELALSILAHNHQLKGVACAVSAVREAGNEEQPLHLLIAGGHRQPYRRTQYGHHVIQYVGSLVDPLPLLAASDVYLHPTFYDACCLSVLEAAACGIPVITTPTNGASDRIVHGDSGFILDNPRDTTCLRKYLRILRDPGQRFVMGHAARSNVQAWAIVDNFTAIEKIHFDTVTSELERNLTASH